MFVIPTGSFTLALKDAGTWRFHIDETMNYVKPVQMVLPEDAKSWELSFNESNRYTFAEKVQNWIIQNERKYAFRYLGALAGDFHHHRMAACSYHMPSITLKRQPQESS
jgi:fructose-1,6-bisphosphatase I